MKPIKSLKKAIEALENGKVLQDEEGSIYFSDDKELLEHNECSYIHVDYLIEYGTSNSVLFPVQDIALPVIEVDEYRYLIDPETQPLPQILEVNAEEFYHYLGKSFFPEGFDFSSHDTLFLMAKKITDSIDFQGVDVFVGWNSCNVPVFTQVNMRHIPFNQFSNLVDWWHRERFLSTIKYGVNHINMPDFLVKKLLGGNGYEIFNNDKIKNLVEEPVLSAVRGTIALVGEVDPNNKYLPEAEKVMKKYGIKLIFPLSPPLKRGAT